MGYTPKCSEDNVMSFPTRSAACLLIALVSAPLFAATAAAPATTRAPTAQQQRMAQCAAQNKGKTAEAYKAAQKACLSGKPAPAATAAAAAMTPQRRMAHCAAQNKGKKGAEYKAAQSACLKAR